MNVIPLIDGRFRCQKSGHCCCSPNIIVTLTFEDIFRLFERLDGNFDQLIKKLSFYRLEKSTTEETLKQLVLNPINSSDGLIIPGLKKFEGGICIFYHQPNCTIYESRPLACRTYPLAFVREKDNLLITWAKDSESTCIGIGKNTKIPSNQLKKQALIFHKMIEEHNLVVDKINQEAEIGRSLTGRESVLILLAYGQKSTY